jgi:hypothetical protein
MLTLLHRAALLLLVVGSLAACGVPTATLTPTPEPTTPPTATVAPPTPTPTIAPPTPTTLPTATPEPPTATPVPPTPTPEPIRAEGALARGSLTSRPAAIMFDNHPAAYPQTGLAQASVVFEALAEFGITRYMGIYAEGITPALSNIGPVRSARAYYVEWAKGLRATYVHAGGSPDGLLLAETSIELVNMDALRSNTRGAFRRSSDRAAPHNLFTDSAAIAEFTAAQDAGTPDLSEIGFLFKADAPLSERPAAQSLSYYFIYRDTYVAWAYRPETNDYVYFRQQRPHVDGRTGEQLRFKNVVILEVPERPVPGDAKGRIEQQVIGEGPARIFRDGRMIEATWRKPAGFAQLQLYTNADGAEAELNAGTVWIAAIPSLENLVVE